VERSASVTAGEVTFSQERERENGNLIQRLVRMPSYTWTPSANFTGSDMDILVKDTANVEAQTLSISGGAGPLPAGLIATILDMTAVEIEDSSSAKVRVINSANVKAQASFANNVSLIGKLVDSVQADLPNVKVIAKASASLTSLKQSDLSNNSFLLGPFDAGSLNLVLKRSAVAKGQVSFDDSSASCGNPNLANEADIFVQSCLP